MSDVIFKRKFRFTFEGFDENQNSVAPEKFVRLYSRPVFPYTAIATETGGEIVSLPGQINIYQSHLLDEGFAEKEVVEFNEKIEDIKSAFLKLYDGCGELIEQWHFLETEMSLYFADYDETEWTIKYEKCDYKYFSTKPFLNKQSS